MWRVAAAQFERSYWCILFDSWDCQSYCICMTIIIVNHCKDFRSLFGARHNRCFGLHTGLWCSAPRTAISSKPRLVLPPIGLLSYPTQFRRHRDDPRQVASQRLLQILFLGDLSRRKGLHDLIRALALDPLRSLEWHLSVAGGGNEIGVFREQAQAAGLSNRISFLGWVDRAKTMALLDAADILVLPSYAEGMAMAVLEGMSHGLCIVCTPVGSLKYVIENEATGLLVQPGEVDQLAKALARAVTDPALRERLGSAAARVFAAKFDAAGYPDRTRPIYQAAFAATARFQSARPKDRYRHW